MTDMITTEMGTDNRRIDDYNPGLQFGRDLPISIHKLRSVDIPIDDYG